MRITIRIYRTHDFDLMSLYQSGDIPLAKAMKKAIIAYYCGEHFRFDVKRNKTPDIKNMPLVVNLLLHISDYDAPGIEHWISGLLKGYRNSCFKSIFRHYLNDPCMTFYREDGIITKPVEVAKDPVKFPKLMHRKKTEYSAQEWLDAVADGSIERKRKGKKPRDLDEIFETSEEPADQLEKNIKNNQEKRHEESENASHELTKPVEQITHDENSNDMLVPENDTDMNESGEEFDDFAAFESIMN